MFFQIPLKKNEKNYKDELGKVSHSAGAEIAELHFRFAEQSDRTGTQGGKTDGQCAVMERCLRSRHGQAGRISFQSRSV